jgi:ceramide glucosyltransferase
MRTLLTPVGALAAFEWIVHAMRPADEFLLVATAVFFGLCALAGIVYTIAATLLVQRFFQRAASEPSTCPPVTIVKPLHGDEWKLLDALESFCRQDYPGAIQFLFGVENEDDLALASVRTLTEIFPEAHITVVVDPRLRAANRKVSNLLNMMPSAVHDWLVFADSDVQVPPNYLRHVIGELQKPGVGLVTCV